MDSSKFIVGDIVKLNKKYSRKRYIVFSIADDSNYIWITTEKEYKHKREILKVKRKELVLISRNQIFLGV
ncbi:hypothetical protein ACSXAC_15380 (plasmid) [Clostridium perfringens]